MTQTNDPNNNVHLPGPIPEKYIRAIIISCERAVVEENTKVVNVFGAFTGMNIEYKKKDGQPKDTENEVLPFPAGHLFLRFISSGVEAFKWSIFFRVATINGVEIHGPAVPLANGNIDVHADHGRFGLADAVLPFLGTGLRLTPERKALIKSDGAVVVEIQYEVWSGDLFLVAHRLNLQYNAIRTKQHDDTNPSQTANTP
jgi:hypothetical protein